MVARTIRVLFPQSLIREPVIFTVAKTSGAVPSIIYAKIGRESAEFVLKLEGEEEEVEHAVRLFKEKGAVSPAEGTD